MSEHDDWSRAFFAKMLDDGLWFIPRTGMVFRKNQQAQTMVWVGTFPPEEEFPSPKHLEWCRAAEFIATRHMFGDVGVAVDRGYPLEDYTSIEAAKVAQKAKMMVRLS